MDEDKLLVPMRANAGTLRGVIDMVLQKTSGPRLDAEAWERGRYKPTPTIIEAATALYGGHSVDDISRSDASAINLSRTSDAISEIIKKSRDRQEKAICLVTGVPGAGKTLIGIQLVYENHLDESDIRNNAVFLLPAMVRW